jgi:hypothetical protein
MSTSARVKRNSLRFEKNSDRLAKDTVSVVHRVVQTTHQALAPSADRATEGQKTERPRGSTFPRGQSGREDSNLRPLDPQNSNQVPAGIDAHGKGREVNLQNALGDTSGHGAAATLPLSEGVETALARALERASAAGRWDVVAQLARELEARRLGRT